MRTIRELKEKLSETRKQLHEDKIKTLQAENEILKKNHERELDVNNQSHKKELEKYVQLVALQDQIEAEMWKQINGSGPDPEPPKKQAKPDESSSKQKKVEENQKRKEPIEKVVEKAVEKKDPPKPVKKPQAQPDPKKSALQDKRLRDRRAARRELDATLIGGTRWSYLKKFAMKPDFREESWWVSAHPSKRR